MKTNSKYRLPSLLVLVFASLTFLAACSKDDDSEVTPMPQQKSIVETATSNPDFSILVQALTKADLVNTINASNNITVFAPTNDAFQQLFTALGVSGIDALSKETLTPILLYHVVGAKLPAASINTGYVQTASNGPSSRTLSMFVEKSSAVKINNSATVIQADLMATNGIIHVIDRVLLPNTVVDIASNNGSFTTLVQALVKADLVAALQEPGPFTVFAPTNEAFASLFSTLGVSGIADLTKEQLQPILLYHVVSGNVLSGALTNGQVSTLNGSITVSINSGVVINGNSTVILADVQGTNGVVHALNKVLLPQ